MNSANNQTLLQYIRRLAGEPQSPPSDGELLHRYLDRRDQAAFAALVQRHGTMVFAVCHSVLRHRDDAEDAFQAAFLILARKAGSIRRQEGLAGWLQRVAYHVALKARANNVRRQTHEAKAIPTSSAATACDDLSWGEVRAILHTELAALPEPFRAPLVLCYLEGLTQEEAAQQLGWTAATVKGRLQRGREKLRRRLERRGVGLAAALGAALAGQALAETSMGALRPFTAETATTAAAALARGLGDALTWLKWKVLAVVLLSAGLAVGGAGMLSPRPAEEGPTMASASKSPAERSAPRTDLYGDPLPEGAIARMGSMQMRHAGLSDFVFLPGGKTMVSAGGGRVLRFWDTAGRKLVREVKLQGAVGPVGLATLSPDGKTVAALNQKSLLFWDAGSGKQIQKIDGQPDNAIYLHFSPDSKILAVGRWDEKVTLWEWEKKKERRLPLPARKAGIDTTFHGCFFPDGKRFVAGGGWDSPLCVYESATGREVRRFDCSASISTVSPDSKRLAVASMKNDKGTAEVVLRFFDLASGKETAQYSLDNPRPLADPHYYHSLAFSPDGKLLACGGSDRSCLLDCASGRIVHRLSGYPTRMAFFPDGKTLAASTGRRFRFWDIATGREEEDRAGDFGEVPILAVSPDGRLLAAAESGEPAVSLWDTMRGKLLRRFLVARENRYICHLAFSADGNTLMAGQYKGGLWFWDVATGKEERRLQLRDPNRRKENDILFFHMHVSPDGRHLSTLEQLYLQGEFTRLACWDAATGKVVSQHLLPPQSRECAWSADGRTVTLALTKGLTQMRVETGAVRSLIPKTANSSRVVLSPDDRLLAALCPAKNNKITVGIWEAATGKKITTLAGDRVSALILRPDNRHLITADDRSLRVWDLATGEVRQRWPLPEEVIDQWGGDAVRSLLLSPNGRRAFTALADGTALVWDLTPALRRNKARTSNPSAKELAAWWADLAAEDAAHAYAAIWRLSEAPEATIPFLRQRLHPATDADIEAVRRLIADLDSDEFATREKAFEQLAQLGPIAVPVLRQALEKKPALEARRRIQLLLEKIDGQPVAGESLRLLRTLQVLENTGIEGRRLLRELANGAEGAWLTRAAQAALTRMARSPSRTTP